MKYNQLLSNCLIFYIVAAMSRVLADLRQEGYPVDADAVAALSPYITTHLTRFGRYITTHLTRFGRYSLDLARVPATLDYDLPILSTRSGREGPGAVIHRVMVKWLSYG